LGHERSASSQIDIRTLYTVHRVLFMGLSAGPVAHEARLNALNAPEKISR